MEKLEITKDYERIAAFSKAISHPTRVAIMFFLADRKEECFFGDIHEVLNIAKPTLSQHLAELKKAGLVLTEEFPPRVKYKVNSEEWDDMRKLYARFFNMCGCRKESCTCGCCL